MVPLKYLKLLFTAIVVRNIITDIIYQGIRSVVTMKKRKKNRRNHKYHCKMESI
jgi:hypothetical protein